MSSRPERLFPKICPYDDCPSIQKPTDSSPNSGLRVRKSVGGFRRKGFYWRTSDSHRVSRFLCLACRRTFSSARFFANFRQKKRQLNASVYEHLLSNVSLRRIALLLRTNRKTVARKKRFLVHQAQSSLRDLQAHYRQPGRQLTEIHFDEMESFERSKCLPLSIPLVVEAKTRKILAFRVCSMPAKGPLARLSRKKYGRRPDERAQAAASLFEEIRPLVRPGTRLISDQNPKYPGWIRAGLPEVQHRTVKGRRGCVVGQGELKKGGWDPLFSLNHTCAMIRSNLSRMARRTWCTTKKAERLSEHLALFVQFHNEKLTEAWKSTR